MQTHARLSSLNRGRADMVLGRSSRWLLKRFRYSRLLSSTISGGSSVGGKTDRQTDRQAV